jgi:hypothetical protein
MNKAHEKKDGEELRVHHAQLELCNDLTAHTQEGRLAMV